MRKEPKSIWDLINALKKVKRVLGSAPHHTLHIALKILRDCLALLVISSTWRSHFRFLWKITPRYLTWVLNKIKLFPTLILGDQDCVYLLKTIQPLVAKKGPRNPPSFRPLYKSLFWKILYIRLFKSVGRFKLLNLLKRLYISTLSYAVFRSKKTAITVSPDEKAQYILNMKKMLHCHVFLYLCESPTSHWEIYTYVQGTTLFGFWS